MPEQDRPLFNSGLMWGQFALDGMTKKSSYSTNEENNIMGQI